MAGGVAGSLKYQRYLGYLIICDSGRGEAVHTSQLGVSLNLQTNQRFLRPYFLCQAAVGLSPSDSDVQYTLYCGSSPLVSRDDLGSWTLPVCYKYKCLP